MKTAVSREVVEVLGAYDDRKRACRDRDRLAARLRQMNLTGRYGMRLRYAQGVAWLWLVDREDGPTPRQRCPEWLNLGRWAS